MPRVNGATRREIFQQIKIRGCATAEELAEYSGISQVAVRLHLAHLMRDGLIWQDVIRSRPGRPQHRYMLTALGDEQFPRSYSELSALLLQELSDWLGADASFSLVSRIREKSDAAIRQNLQILPDAHQLERLSAIRNAEGYMTELECNSNSGMQRIVYRNCTACRLSANYPQLCCQGDAALLQKTLAHGEMVCEAHRSQGDSFCVYRLQPCKAALPNGSHPDSLAAASE